MEKVTVYYSIDNGGDGSASLIWFLTSEEAEKHQEEMYEGWGEPCFGPCETFKGSDTYFKAKKNSEDGRV